jgi:hypothetical protein
MANEITDSGQSAGLQQAVAKSRAEQAARDEQARKTTAARKSAGMPNPTATERAQREEELGHRPKVGSNAEQRAGMDPRYATNPNAAQGLQSNRNISESEFQRNFPKVDPFPVATPPTAAEGGPSNVPQSSNVPRGTNPQTGVYGSGLWPAPKVEWTGPSLMPKLGPAAVSSAPPSHAGQVFVVPKPLTGPTGNAATDAANDAQAAAMIAPGGGASLWHNTTPPPSPTEYGPDPRFSAANASGVAWKTPYGSISEHLPAADSTGGVLGQGPLVGNQATGAKHAASPAPFSPVNWADLAENKTLPPELNHLQSGTGPTQIPSGMPSLATPTAPPQQSGPIPGTQQPNSSAKAKPPIGEDDEEGDKSASTAPKMEAYS